MYFWDHLSNSIMQVETAEQFIWENEPTNKFFSIFIKFKTSIEKRDIFFYCLIIIPIFLHPNFATLDSSNYELYVRSNNNKILKVYIVWLEKIKFVAKSLVSLSLFKSEDNLTFNQILFYFSWAFHLDIPNINFQIGFPNTFR